ncbi:MAG: hypothetical protein EON58_17115 [Alphaproteobacteria bacterium]|nr:MAG: hypothetical protein EON58_17115 [Alphaproteobacteria bacterium]
MISIEDRDSITSVLTDSRLDPELRVLIGLRAWQMDVERDRPLNDTIRFVVIQPGDTPEVINSAVGFPITWELAEQPSFEWMEDHGSWFEIGYVLTDDLGLLVYVADHPGTEFGIHYNCLGFCDRQVCIENKQ